MDRFDADLDRRLGEWLRDESLTRAPSRLAEDVFARTSRTRQARRWWPSASVLRPRGRDLHIAGREARWTWTLGWATSALALVILAGVVALTSGPRAVGPGTSGAPGPSPSSSPAASPSPLATRNPRPTPAATMVGALPALRLELGADAAPIALIDAFGSIWVADIHANDVRRFDASTMRELARIPVAGAAWFAVADEALWVTDQTGAGLTRIDPVANRVAAHVGDVAPCGAPVVAFDSIWQAACDADVVLRIDPSRDVVVDTIPARGHDFLVAAGGRLISIGPQGLANLDPATRTYAAIPGLAGVNVADFLASDGTTIWAKGSSGIDRIDPATGRIVASIPDPAAQAISFAGDHGWLTVTGEGVREIDLATNEVRRTIPVSPAPLFPLEAAGALWVTDFESSALWRIEP